MKKQIISCGAAIFKNKKLLLCKRPSTLERFPNHWGCPGGKLDPGESVEECVVREVKEEVGLDFVPEKLYGIYGRGVRNKKFGGHVFVGEYYGKIKLQKSEVEKVEWFTYEEAKKLPLSFSYLKVIEDLHKDDYF